MSILRLPKPFTSDLKVLVLCGSNDPSARHRQARARRVARGQPEVPLEHKAFLRLKGRLIVEYVLDWLAVCGLHRVWVLARRECLDSIPTQYRFTPLAQAPGSSVATNMAAAHAAILPDPDEPVLVVFGDHPLNTPGALLDFLAACAPDLDRADYFHAVAARQSYRAFAPYFTRTSAHMREFSGRATGLNLAVPARLQRMKVFDQFYADRKLEQFNRFIKLLKHLVQRLRYRSPHALFDATRMYLAKEFERASRDNSVSGSISNLMLEWLRSRVPASRIEYYAARLLGAERGVRLVPVEHGSTGIDVDFLEELLTLEDHWDEINEIARLQEDAAMAKRTYYYEPTSSSSRYAVR